MPLNFAGLKIVYDFTHKYLIITLSIATFDFWDQINDGGIHHICGKTDFEKSTAGYIFPFAQVLFMS